MDYKKEKKGMIMSNIIHPTPYFSEPELVTILSCSNLTPRLVSGKFQLLVIPLTLLKNINISGSTWRNAMEVLWHGPAKTVFIWPLAFSGCSYQG